MRAPTTVVEPGWQATVTPRNHLVLDRYEALDRGHAVLTVDDSGPGVPESARTHVFERFFRGRSGQGEGSGLGLTIARDGAERAGGTVAVAATGKGGTTMRFRLPLVEGD